jgi:hypothetical protein
MLACNASTLSFFADACAARSNAAGRRIYVDAASRRVRRLINDQVKGSIVYTEGSRRGIRARNLVLFNKEKYPRPKQEG